MAENCQNKSCDTHTSATKANESSVNSARKGESHKTLSKGREGPTRCESFFDKGFTIYVPYWLCLMVILTLLLIVIGAIFLQLAAKHSKPDPKEMMIEVQTRSGKSVVDVFRSADRNNDGYVSILEFEPLISYFSNLSQVLDKMKPNLESLLNYSPTDGEEVLIIHANFTPLLLETMTKEDILNFPITGQSALWGFKNWLLPYHSHLLFGANEFKSLLPEDITNLAMILGKPYHILNYRSASESIFNLNIHLSSNRMYPPMPEGAEKVLFRLLSMMHPRPFVQMRFGPKGTVACVQAYNDEYVHIVFRMHAEFQLNEPPNSPFWFTPGQFVGDLVISRNGTHIHYFHMHVPNDKRLNVDMEWMTVGTDGEESGMEVDIGYMPLMEWTLEAESVSIGASVDSSASVTYKPDQVQPLSPEKLQWLEQVPRDQVLRQIEIIFYPFKEVTYHNLTSAVKLSKEQNKPLHGIFLWGALDDQSC